eukprot:COSAG04_NODE_11622_length_698_cov_1.126878_1_plen_64_part_10
MLTMHFPFLQPAHASLQIGGKGNYVLVALPERSTSVCFTKSGPSVFYKISKLVAHGLLDETTPY